MWCNGKEFACQCRRHRRRRLIPGLGRYPGEENGNSLQYSCLESSMDREAWWAIVLGVAKSWMQQSTLTKGVLTKMGG